MNRKILTVIAIAAAIVAWQTVTTVADTISVNFNNGGATLLTDTDEAGFVPATNWNNFRNNGGIGLINPDATELFESDGTISDATISWEVGASFFNSNNGAGNQRMMEGWFGLNADDDGYILFEDLPSSFTTPTYDAYVYFDSDQVAPNERTMTFTGNDTSLTGTEMAANFAGRFFEARDGMPGNFVVFRDLNTPSFRLTADSDFGRAAITGIQITTEDEPDPTEPPDPNAPLHIYNASNADNTDDRFRDSGGARDWTLLGAELVDVDSTNTNISSAYRLDDASQGFGGDNAPFPAGNISYELWVRPGEDTDGHQVIFETGGGQNGTSVILRNDAVRVLNSMGNERGFDIEVPLADVDTSDFVQIVTSLNPEIGEISVTVNGSAGGSASDVAEGPVGRGGNRASLFTWGAGTGNLGNPADEPGGTFNLGGRTELEDMTPEDLREFAGEIAMLTVYPRSLETAEIQSLFDAVTLTGLLGDFNGNEQLDLEDISQLSAVVRDGRNDAEFDLNGDDVVDAEDRKVWVEDLKGTWFGDSNLDGEFSSADFVQVFSAGEFEDETPLNSTWETGDWNGDGDFTTNDFVRAFQDGGYEKGQRVAATQAVPEPSSTLLVILSASSIALSVRQRS